MLQEYKIKSGTVITIPTYETYAKLWNDRPPSDQRIQCGNYQSIIKSGLEENWYKVIETEKEKVKLKLIDPSMLRHLLSESIVSIYDIAEFIEDEYPFLQIINNESTSIIKQTHQDALLQTADGKEYFLYLADTILGVYLCTKTE